MAVNTSVWISFSSLSWDRWKCGKRDSKHSIEFIYKQQQKKNYAAFMKFTHDEFICCSCTLFHAHGFVKIGQIIIHIRGFVSTRHQRDVHACEQIIFTLYSMHARYYPFMRKNIIGRDISSLFKLQLKISLCEIRNNISVRYFGVI